MHCFLWQTCCTATDEADFPWGRFADDQIRQSVSVQPSNPISAAPVVATGSHPPYLPLSRLNDFNGVNRNFTANRGAFGFRKPKKTKQDSKPAISKQLTTNRAKNLKRRTTEKHGKF